MTSPLLVSKGLLIMEVLHQCRLDSCGLVFCPTPRTLSDNTQHTQQTDFHVPGGFKPAIPASEGAQTLTLDRANKCSSLVKNAAKKLS
jgi:hypothetical protein